MYYYLASLINLTLSKADPGLPMMEFSMKIVKELKLETIITNNSISDIAGVLDIPLAIFCFTNL